MEAFAKLVSTIDGWIWGPWLLVLLFGSHIFLTIRTGFIQKKLGLGIKLSVTKDAAGEGDVSQFGALTTALASTIGTGNIIGVGTAIAVGGPGAVLWMWLTGVFGIATKYAESLIAVKYRVKTESGAMLGGAMFALERGLKNKKAGRVLGILFAVFAAFAAFGIGDGVQ
ncbi:MAG: alanine:cation symporter family protein, partial [Treponema sp.]|nr:alanine:cation symporter family protein [Treponema sp.]